MVANILKNLGELHAKKLIKDGSDILDIGGGNKPWIKRNKFRRGMEKNFSNIIEIKKIKKFISLDTRKSEIMERGIRNKINLINDISGLEHDPNTINILLKTKVTLSYIIYKAIKNYARQSQIQECCTRYLRFFEKKIKYIRSKGIGHNNIILDPGIGLVKT